MDVDYGRLAYETHMTWMGEGLEWEALTQYARDCWEAVANTIIGRWTRMEIELQRELRKKTGHGK